MLIISNNKKIKKQLKKNIIIIGFGWSSIGFVQYINTSKYNVTLISKSDYFLYTPLLAQNVKYNRDLTISSKQLNKDILFVHDTVDNIDFNKNKVQDKYYDYLVLSHGSSVNTFNIPGVQNNTYHLKTLEDSIKIKNKLNELPNNSKIAIIGCGLAGTELIGSLSDMKRFNLMAIDGMDRPVITFDKNLSEKVIKDWRNININMYFNNFVQRINHSSLETNKEILNFDMAIWCGGIKISELSKTVNHLLKLDNNRGIPVDKYMNVTNQSNIFAIGDCAYSGYPPTAQVAYQQGIYLAKQFNNRFENRKEFHFQDKGQIAYIGNSKSIYQNNYLKGGGNMVYYFNNLIHLYNFGKIYIKSKF